MDAEKNPFHLLRRLPLVINASTPAVARARQHAKDDLESATSLLARLVLIHYDKLTPDVSLELFEQHEAELPELVGRRSRFIIEENDRVQDLAKALERVDGFTVVAFQLDPS